MILSYIVLDIISIRFVHNLFDCTCKSSPQAKEDLEHGGEGGGGKWGGGGKLLVA